MTDSYGRPYNYVETGPGFQIFFILKTFPFICMGLRAETQNFFQVNLCGPVNLPGTERYLYTVKYS